MTTPTITFFNNKGGVGTTSLVYHLAWMYADRGRRVVTIDLDPQSNLTSFFLTDEQIEQIWETKNSPNTIFRCIQPLIKGTGDILAPELIDAEIDSVSLALLAGDLTLSNFEDDLATVWPECADGRERAFRVTSAIWRVIQKAKEAFDADLVLIDMGPNLGSIDRAIMIATDYIVIPLAADLFSVQGLKNLGPTLNRWRQQWQERTPKNPASDLQIPTGSMKPIGYVAMLHAERVSRPTLAYQRWLAQIPNVYQTEMLGQTPVDYPSFAEDSHFLGKLKHYSSLMPMAQEAHKPIFYLKPADGIVGGHYHAVQDAYRDLLKLAQEIEHRLPQS